LHSRTRLLRVQGAVRFTCTLFRCSCLTVANRQANLWVKAITEGLCSPTCCIEQLNLALMGLSPDGAVLIAAALHKNRTAVCACCCRAAPDGAAGSLNKLVLQSNATLFSRPQSVAAFRDALAVNTTLKDLNLSCTGLRGPRGVGEEGKSPVDVLLEGLRKNNTLTSISVGYCSTLASFTSMHSHLLPPPLAVCLPLASAAHRVHSGNEILLYGVELLADLCRRSRCIRRVQVYRPGIAARADPRSSSVLSRKSKRQLESDQCASRSCRDPLSA
jgi:hypothetical protein